MLGADSVLTEFWHAQLDYIFFCNGLAFFVLAAVCLVLRKGEKNGPAWSLLAAFSILHGAYQWGRSLHSTIRRQPSCYRH